MATPNSTIMPKTLSVTLTLTKEIRELTKEVTRLKDQEFMKVFAHPWKFIWFSFLKGLMIGFGSVLGASVLVGIFIYILAQIRLVPVVGDFIQDVMNQIQIEQKVRQTPEDFKIPDDKSPVDSTKTVSEKNQ